MSLREISLTEVPAVHPAAAFHRFWHQAAEGRRWAPWGCFDATEHPGVLPWVLLLKREATETGGGSVQWRYAVCGTGCTELFGFSYQERLFGEGMPAAAVAEREAEFRRVTEGSGPLFSLCDLPIPKREFVHVLRGLFPFCSNGDGDIDRLFIVVAREEARAE